MGKPESGSRTQDEAIEPLDKLAEDWIALCQSELAGLAADPDWLALGQHSLAIGAGWLRLLGAMAAPPAAPGPANERPAGTPPRPAPAAAAPGHGGDAELGGAGHGGARDADATKHGDSRDGDAAGHGDARDADTGATEAALRQRLAELERRLAALERGPRRGRADSAGARRRRPSA